MVKIKELRLENALTQKEFAERLGLDAHNVGDWERGKGEPNSDMLVKIASVFGVSVDYLLGLEDDFGKTVIGSVPVGSSDSARSAVSTVDDLLSPEERKLIADYRKLDKVSKRAIERTASSLAEDPGDKVKQLFGENKR